MIKRFQSYVLASIVSLCLLGGTAFGAVTFTYTTTNPLCFSQKTGKITVVPSGGTAPYQVSTNGGTTYGTNMTVSSLGTGTYDVIVKDSKGDVSSVQQVTITQPSQITITATKTNLTCHQANDGTITVTASGGTPPYQYSRNAGQTYQASNVFTNVPGTATGFQIRVKDANNCVAFGPTVFVNGPTAVTFVSLTSTPTCFGQTNGKIVALAQGGTHLFAYSIDGGQTYQSSGTFTGLAAGTYSVRAKDSKGCLSKIQSIDVGQTAPIMASGTKCFTTIYGHSTTECATLEAGTISGGTAPYTYQWSTGSTSNSIQVCPSQTTVYQLTVTGKNGCSATFDYEVNVYDARCTAGKSLGNNQGPHKLYVCHVPPGNPGNENTICIDYNGVDAHITAGAKGHENCRIGRCEWTDQCVISKKGEDANDLVTSATGGLIVYPNPAKELIHVEFNRQENEDAVIEIFETSGKKVVSRKINDEVDGDTDVISFDLNALSTGVYILKIKTTTGRSEFARFIIE